jgi:hypothetical protein
MKVKTVTTTLATNTAGQVVESIPVLPTEAAYLDASGQWRDPIHMIEDALGVPIRIVSDAVVLNSAGKPVAAARGEGVGASAYASFPAPAGWHWDFLTEGGVILIERNMPLVELVRN